MDSLFIVKLVGIPTTYVVSSGRRKFLTSGIPCECCSQFDSLPLPLTYSFDTKQTRIFTHVFVHRTHFEIFGYLFPPAFKNWWSDDWISHVYGGRCVACFRLRCYEFRL